MRKLRILYIFLNLRILRNWKEAKQERRRNLKFRIDLKYDAF
jgi:hypothetical protein